MGGSKRMSTEEKRKAILAIYHKSQLVYTEKEIFSIISKAGISNNSTPDIHQGMVDDGLIEKTKISGINYFWSFKAKKERKIQMENVKILKLIDDLKPQVAEVEARLLDAKRGREDGDSDGEETAKEKEGSGGRAKKLVHLSEIGKEKIEIGKELEKLKENDPAALADLEKELKFVTHSVHRWTDNIFECKSYLVKKRGIDKKQADKILQLPKDFDYPEDD